jgi:tetratricopeptide (TPR) repeat protein
LHPQAPRVADTIRDAGRNAYGERFGWNGMERRISVVDSSFPGRRLTGRIRRALRLTWYRQTIGDLDTAARYAQRALALAHSHPAVPAALVADAALAAARVARDREDFAGCQEHLEHAIAVLRAAPGDPDRDQLLALALVGLGDQRRRGGDHAVAREALSEARRLVESTPWPDPGLHAAVLIAQGYTATELGAFDEAAQCYARVSRLQRAHGASRADAATLERHLAGLENARGRHPQAETHARQALALRCQAPRVNPVERAPDLAVLASALAGQGRYDEARALLTETIAAYREARPPRRYELAEQLRSLADLERRAALRAVS